MAAGSWVIPDLAKLNIASATNILAATAGNFRLALVSSAWTPNNATDEVWSVASGSEIANGNGYTTGGATPSTITQSSASVITPGPASLTITTYAPTVTRTTTEDTTPVVVQPAIWRLRSIDIDVVPQGKW